MNHYQTLPVERLLEQFSYAMTMEAHAEYADAPGMRDREVHEARRIKAEILEEMERRTRTHKCALAWLEEARAAEVVPPALGAVDVLRAVAEGRMPKQEGA